MTDNMPVLGRLERVPLRAVWRHEAGVFTPWLSKAENLQLLADALGMPALELVGTERMVSEFSCDIVACNPSNGDLVAIENQIEVSDHKHLGQAVTYVAGTDAKALVWITERFAEGHRAALEWLNQKTSEDVAFFGVEVEAWKIGASPAAPRFNVVVRPNNWARETRAIVHAPSPISGLRQEYWDAFMRVWQGPGPNRPPRDTNFYSKLGSAFAICAYLLQSRDKVGLYVACWRADVDAIKSAIERDQEQIERRLGRAIRLDRRQGQTLWMTISEMTADVTNRSDWPRQHQWLAEEMQLTRDVMAPWVQENGFAGAPAG